jgi:hypothetical protein
MLKAIFNWFTSKPVPGTEAPVVKAESAPYKVEPPPVVKVSEPAPVGDHVRVEATAPVESAPKAKRAPAVKKAVAPKAPAKPRAKKAPKQ